MALRYKKIPIIESEADFFEALKVAANKFRWEDCDGAIRGKLKGKVKHREYCPITAVGFVFGSDHQSGDYEYVVEELDMKIDHDEIVNASDSNEETKTRKKIMRAVGLAK